MRYWRTILCASGLGVCGLAVWANDCVRGKALARDTAVVAAAEPAPAGDPQPAPASDAEPPVKVIMDIGTPSLPVAPPVVPPPVIPPITDPHVEKAGASKNEPVNPPKFTLPEEPPPLPAGKLALPPSSPEAPKTELVSDPPKITPPPPPISPSLDLPKPGEKPASPSKPIVDLPKAPASPSPAADLSLPPAAPRNPSLGLPSAPSVPSPNVPPSPEPPAAAPSTPPAPGPFKMFLRMGGSARPRFEVKDGDALILKVYFDHVDLKNTHEGLTATGNVRLHGSGLDGTCDQLSLSSTKGEVELKGNVKLTCYRGGASSQLTAEQVKFQLKGATEPVKPPSGKVVPANWSSSR